MSREGERVRSNDNKSVAEEAPRIVYHYTATPGLIGIIDNAALWATDLQFLNDSREFIHGRDLAILSAQRLLQNARDDSEPMFSPEIYDMLGQSMREVLDSLNQTLRTFVTCFSENGDSLSLWRGYAADGFALGFESSMLSDQTYPQISTSLSRVVYEPEDQARLVDDLSGESARESLEALRVVASEGWEIARETKLAGGKEMPPIPEVTHERFSDSTVRSMIPLYRTCFRLKDRAFREEEEWRFCQYVTDMREVLFRANAYGPLPYVTVGLKSESDHIDSLREIVIGPSEYNELRETAVRILLRRYGYSDQDVQVRHSSVPFRRL